MEKLIIKAFRTWCVKHLDPDVNPTTQDAFTFYLGLPLAAGHGDHWSAVHGALYGAGIIEAAEECIFPRWIPEI